MRINAESVGKGTWVLVLEVFWFPSIDQSCLNKLGLRADKPSMWKAKEVERICQNATYCLTIEFFFKFISSHADSSFLNLNYIQTFLFKYLNYNSF